MSSLVDTKSLRDLEVMKSYHGITSVVTEESLGVIWKRYSIPEDSPLEVEEVRVEATPKRHVGTLVAKREAPTRAEKRVKMTVGKHKFHYGEGSSRAPSRDKEPTTSSEEDVPPTYC
ncbi:hypothetical protein BHM03_00004644 [Ensete ventricosum]|nr:hypothetical protein BHM03_00004644 [Ensete ventricosum]